MTCWWRFRHRWSRWTDIDKGTLHAHPISDGVTGRYIVQERRCVLCGRVQLRTAGC